MDERSRPVLNPDRRRKLAAEVAVAPSAPSAPSAPGTKPASGGRVALAVGLGVLSMGGLLALALMPGAKLPKAPVAAARNAEQIVEHDNDWVERADDAAPGGRLQQALREGSGLKAGHREIRTSCLRINLRTIEGTDDPAVSEGKQAAKPVPETGSYPSAPPPRAALEEGEAPPAVEPEAAGE